MSLWFRDFSFQHFSVSAFPLPAYAPAVLCTDTLKRIISGAGLLWVVAALAAESAGPPALTNQWSALVGGFVDSSPAVGDDGAIYFGSFDGDLRALNSNGSLRWIFHVGREIKSSPALGADGVVYFGSRDRRFHAVGRDGKKQWEFATGAWVDSSPALAADGTIYFGSWDKTFYALNPTGSKKWQFAAGGEIVSSPAIDANGRIFFGAHDGKFYALSTAGTKLWDYQTGGPILSSPAIDKDGTLYFTSVDGFFYALNPDGSLKWRLRTGGITESSPVIGQDGTLVVAVNNTFWGITPDGKKRWDLYADPNDRLLNDSSPLALADSSFCAVAASGQVADIYTTPPSGPWNPWFWFFYHGRGGNLSPAIGPTGIIYVAGDVLNAGCILCALPAKVPLATSAWPKFRGNPRNTGRQSPSK